LNQGINVFDTAQAYGWGQSERMLAEALRDDLDHNRDEVIVATKGGLRMDDGKLKRDSREEWLRTGVGESLRNLGVDYIDLYQVHWPDESVPIEETAGVLDEFVQEGKVRYVGTHATRRTTSSAQTSRGTCCPWCLEHDVTAA
jgi:aryl-alcohol dehydrogenase-like predicted oxidoreductase